jgi:hypothetical protein
MLRMPPVLCDGHISITVVDPRDDEVRVGLGLGHVVYLKRDKHETYDDFVRRVTKYCEDQYMRRGR